MLNRIHPAESLDSVLGKVVIQAVPLSIGASVANALLSARGREGEVWQHQNAYHLPVAIANRGDRTAEDVQVELSVRSEQGRLETAPLRVQFLAGGETARGVVVFREDPTRGNLAVGVISYRTP